MAIASEAGHWYARDGSPAYETIGKDGLPRKTTLRDARIKRYGPGVSDIIKMYPAPQLENWKIEQAILTSADAPRQAGETNKAYLARIKAATKERLDKAPDLGTVIHGCIEKKLGSQLYDQTFKPHVEGALTSLAEWCGGLDGISSEKSFFHPLGFGGKCDIHKPRALCVADFKSKEFDHDELPATYDNHAMQCAAYREGFQMPEARCAIIYVSTKVPGLTHLVEIDQAELERGWRMFRYCLDLWKLKNRYQPEGN